MVWCVWSGCKKKVKPCGKGLKVALVVVMSFQSSHDPAKAATLFSVCPWRLWKDWSNDWKIHGIWWSVWNLDLEYGYESIPIDTIFSGMNIHLPAILMFTRGNKVLTHCHIWITQVTQGRLFVKIWAWWHDLIQTWSQFKQKHNMAEGMFYREGPTSPNMLEHVFF